MFWITKDQSSGSDEILKLLVTTRTHTTGSEYAAKHRPHTW